MIDVDVNECEERNCNGNGYCEDGINDYTCLCKSGYSGKDCQYSGISFICELKECDDIGGEILIITMTTQQSIFVKFIGGS